MNSLSTICEHNIIENKTPFHDIPLSLIQKLNNQKQWNEFWDYLIKKSKKSIDKIIIRNEYDTRNYEHRIKEYEILLNSKENDENKNILQWLICPHCKIRLVNFIMIGTKTCTNRICRNISHKIISWDIDPYLLNNSIYHSIPEYYNNPIYRLFAKFHNTVILMNVLSNEKKYRKKIRDNTHLLHMPMIDRILCGMRNFQEENLICESPHPSMSIKNCLKELTKININEENKCVGYLGITSIKTNYICDRDKLENVEKINENDYDKPLNDVLKNIEISEEITMYHSWHIVIYIYLLKK
jgi:hypothetical protein